MKTLFVAGTVFFPEEFLRGGVHHLECVLFPASDAEAARSAGEQAALVAVQRALRQKPELHMTDLGLPILAVQYEAYRPARLEFGACQVALALKKRFGDIVMDVKPAAVSLCRW